MYKHILIPVELASSQKDYTKATQVARKLLAEGGTISSLHVIEPIPVYAESHIPPDVHMKSRETAREALDLLAETLEIDKRALIVGPAGRSIVQWAEENAVDCIVVASHTPGLSDWVLGSTATWIVKHSPTALHVLR